MPLSTCWLWRRLPVMQLLNESLSAALDMTSILQARR